MQHASRRLTPISIRSDSYIPRVVRVSAFKILK